MYPYIKAFHIIFIVTWFAGLFYMPRLLIYNTEATEKPAAESAVLRKQFAVMIKRLWLGITWPSAILTLIFGPWLWFLLGVTPTWLLIKLIFVAGLILYHFSLDILYRQQMKGIFKYSSQQLRIWNEIATLFLFAIVFTAVVKDSLNWIWALTGLGLIVVILMAAIKIYKKLRDRSK
jgi:protoporphyrinogen IX oxidase